MEMVATLQGIRQLEQERNRVVDELRRLQRAVARRDDQDKEAAKAAEKRRIEALKIPHIEAAKVPDTIFSTARGACGIYNVIAVRSRVESCFFAASGADDALGSPRVPNSKGRFVPCHIRSLADPCQSAVCSDP